MAKSTQNSSNEIFSKDEIDELLQAISSENSSSSNSNNSSNSSDEFKPVSDTRKIKIYDFKRPDVFRKEQIRLFSNIYDSICREYTFYLSEKLKKAVRIHVASADQLTYEEFCRSLPTPTEYYKSNVGSKPFALEISPEAYNILSGGKLALVEKTKRSWRTGKDEKVIVPEERSLEKAEVSELISDFIEPFLKIQKETLESQLEISMPNYNNQSFSHNAGIVNVASPNDMVLLISMILSVSDDQEGFINVCLTVPLVKALLNAFNDNPPKKNTLAFDDISETLVPYEVVLGKTKRTIKDTMEIGEGTIIELDKLAGEPVDIKINGKICATGEVVVIDENFGVRVTEIL